jgi:hypothetical protein
MKKERERLNRSKKALLQTLGQVDVPVVIALAATRPLGSGVGASTGKEST